MKEGKVEPFTPPTKPEDEAPNSKKTLHFKKRRAAKAAIAEQEEEAEDDEEEENEAVATASAATAGKLKATKPKIPASKSVKIKTNVTEIINGDDLPALTANNEDEEDSAKETDLIIDSGAMMHMMHTRHPAMTSVTKAHRSALFGNDQRLRIEQEADLGDLKQVQICSGMSKQLVSVGQLATTNGMITIFTETGCYVMRPEFQLEVPEGVVALFAPLVDGLYRVELNDLADGLGN